MASPEAMEKLRAVLDYAPEEAVRRLPGDPQEDYDALTRRLSRTVAVKSLVARRVIVEQPDVAEGPEPEAPRWEPPAPAEPVPAWQEPPPVEPAPAWQEAPPAWPTAAAEAASVVEAAEPSAEPAAAEMPQEDFFDVVKTGPGPVEMEPVEPDVSLSESEWRTLEESAIPEEEAEAPAVAGQEPTPSEEEAFEEIELPAGGEAEAPPESAVVEGELEPGEVAPEALPEAPPPQPPEPTAEFEVEEAEAGGADEFEILEEEEAVVEEGEEPPYQINEFTLFRRGVRAKGARVRSSFFFSAEPTVEGAVPSPLPEGYEVIVNESTGIPVIRKSQARFLPVIDIEGLGPVMAERLERAGVRTTRDLLRVDVRRVSEETGISERLLGNFRAMANLLQLPGLYPDQAAGLVYAGVRNLEDLRSATPSELAKQVNQAAKDHQLKLRGKMTPSRVRAWQEKVAKLTAE